MATRRPCHRPAAIHGAPADPGRGQDDVHRARAGGGGDDAPRASGPDAITGLDSGADAIAGPDSVLDVVSESDAGCGTVADGVASVVTADRGATSVLVLVLLLLVALFSLAFADAANVLVAYQRARVAADAAALAAAAEQWRATSSGAEPADAALRYAERNGARLDACDCPRSSRRARVTVSAPTRIRMLSVAPSRMSATAIAAVDPSALFRPDG